MANSKSAIKRARQNEKRRVQHRVVRSKLRTMLNQFEEALTQGDQAAAEQAFRKAEGELMRAASKGVIPRERASRRTGRMASRLSKLGAAGEASAS